MIKIFKIIEKVVWTLVQLREQKEREERMKKTEEYTMLIFSLAKTPVEDVEKVWLVTNLFPESDRGGRNLRVPSYSAITRSR